MWQKKKGEGVGVEQVVVYMSFSLTRAISILDKQKTVRSGTIQPAGIRYGGIDADETTSKVPRVRKNKEVKRKDRDSR